MIQVGSPAILNLDAFGRRVFEAFGHHPYVVGSATRGKKWRDVDVRLILPDDQYDALFGPRRAAPRLDLKWALLCAAISALGQQQTGLPIDFQIDRQTEANEQHGGEPRHALGLRAEQQWEGEESE